MLFSIMAWILARDTTDLLSADVRVGSSVGRSPLPFQGLEAGIVLFCVRFDNFLRRFRKILNKTAYPVSKLLWWYSVSLPGEPVNSASAGTTVFGGIMVLSSIFAQSLIVVNLPCLQVNTSRRN